MTLRGHHLLCVLGFRGKGYSQPFVENLAALVEALRREPDGPLELEESPDDICAACPHLSTHRQPVVPSAMTEAALLMVSGGPGPSRCAKRPDSEERVRLHDRRVLEALGLEAGGVLTWQEAARVIRSRVAPADLHHLCAGCPWLPLGYCASGLEALQRGEHPLGPVAQGP